MKTKYYLLSAGFAVAICYANWHFTGWDYHMPVAMVIFALLVYWKRPKDPISIIEKWGECAESKSGVTWSLPRKMDWHTGTDSRETLEKFGFKILGIADAMFYFVEPPEGWYQDSLHHLSTYIYNKEGKGTLVQFSKNDIMNPSDYRSFLYLWDKVC